ncbi:transcriptional regulator, TetR family [Plantibacter flavus]|uniref:TetR family transcriptional regulator n=1 Tax=Plantibacter flavus TaxID=150123 RepID=A0A3N2BXU0_9MICO|nr:TetR/AcrR family transcriptional regulator [Plantibacter flavus]ROR80070.1 TetR family transcriptional regulator [Plantibacter flavus]SMG29188.1 transcriptional regulator, TetR family [Plantibacter flavus]
MTEPAGSDTRSKILIAAATMLGEDPTARLSVRAVAAKAGVSTGSLRHFFPTQQELLDTVIEGLQTLDIPDDPMADPTKTPAERLQACLQLLLSAVGTGAVARQNWTALHDAYVASPTPEESAQTFLAMERLAVSRVDRWLARLHEEGALTDGDREQQSRFLLSVVNGLSLERAFPGARARLGFESSSLRLAVTAVLRADAS